MNVFRLMQNPPHTPVDQVIDWLQKHTDTCEWADFEFKAVEERGRKRR